MDLQSIKVAELMVAAEAKAKAKAQVQVQEAPKDSALTNDVTPVVSDVVDPLPGEEPELEVVKVTLTLPNLSAKLGLKMVENAAANEVYLNGLVAGSIAAANRMLKPGLRFEKVAGESVHEFSKAEVTAKLKKAAGKMKVIELEFHYELDTYLQVLSSTSETKAQKEITATINRLGGTPVGLKLLEGVDGQGTFIRAVTPGSVSDECHSIFAGLLFLSVNGQDASEAGRTAVATMLKSAGDTITLKLRPDPRSYARAMVRILLPAPHRMYRHFQRYTFAPFMWIDRCIPRPSVYGLSRTV